MCSGGIGTAVSFSASSSSQLTPSLLRHWMIPKATRAVHDVPTTSSRHQHRNRRRMALLAEEQYAPTMIRPSGLVTRSSNWPNPCSIILRAWAKTASFSTSIQTQNPNHSTEGRSARNEEPYDNQPLAKMHKTTAAGSPLRRIFFAKTYLLTFARHQQYTPLCRAPAPELPPSIVNGTRHNNTHMVHHVLFYEGGVLHVSCRFVIGHTSYLASFCKRWSTRVLEE